MLIKEEEVSILREKGLSVTQLFPENHVYSGGYSICKPIEVIGNSLPNYKLVFGSENKETDAPCSVFFQSKGKYIFTVWEFIPGPGPGDFWKSFNTPQEAVEAILEYYFGHSKEFTDALIFYSNR